MTGWMISRGTTTSCLLRCGVRSTTFRFHLLRGDPDRRMGGAVRRAAACEHWQVTSFKSGEKPWADRLGNLRNVVRQEVIARQIAPLAGPGIAASTLAVVRAPRHFDWHRLDAG